MIGGGRSVPLCVGFFWWVGEIGSAVSLPMVPTSISVVLSGAKFSVGLAVTICTFSVFIFVGTFCFFAETGLLDS
jgi:hypothetical protein